MVQKNASGRRTCRAHNAVFKARYSASIPASRTIFVQSGRSTRVRPQIGVAFSYGATSVCAAPIQRGC